MKNEEIAGLIETITECVFYVRLQNYFYGRRYLTEWTKRLGQSTVLEESDLLRESLLPTIYEALENGDMILAADYLEQGVVPCLASYVQCAEPIETPGYRLETSATGRWTVYAKQIGKYLHSNNDPVQEAGLLVRNCYDPQKSVYVVWGCGLGYHIDRLYEISDQSIKIKVFEEDEELWSIFQEYGIIRENKDIEVIWDPSGERFCEALSERGVGLIMHYPSVLKIKNPALRDLMRDFYADWNGTVQNQNIKTVSFRKNTENCTHVVDELEEKLKGADVVIIGGGPSVDSNRSFLEEHSDWIFIATNTIVPALLHMGIRPDYIIAMDCEGVLWMDLEEAKDLKIPLIVDSTASWRLAENFSGERYIVYQREHDLAEEAAQRIGARTYETGGSVVTLAVSVAAQLGAGRIFLLGADFANPNGQTHAQNTKRMRKITDQDVPRVLSVNGEMVETDIQLLSYKKWVEQAIRKYPHIPFYNMSDCGAYIEGTKQYHD